MPFVKAKRLTSLHFHVNLRRLTAKNRARTRRALSVRRHLRLGAAGAKRTGGRGHNLKGRRHASGYHFVSRRGVGGRHPHKGAKGIKHRFAHRAVHGHHTRAKHSDKPRKRAVHVHRRTVHLLKRRIVHKGYHHKNHSHVVHHAHRHHKGYHGHRKRRR